MVLLSFGGIRRGLHALVLACILIPQISAQDMAAVQKRIEKLEKSLSALDARIVKQEQAIERKRAELRPGWENLQNPGRRQQAALRIGLIAQRYRDALGGGTDAAAAQKAVTEEITGLIADIAGREYAGLIGPYLAEEVTAAAETKPFPAQALLDGAIADVLSEGSFEADFDAKLLKRYEGRLPELQLERQGLVTELESLTGTLDSMRSGRPPGMVEVPASRHTVGIDDKDLRELAKDLNYGSNPESLILLWRSSPAQDVELPAYYIDRHEVTNAWWAAFLKEHPEARVPRYWEEGKIPAGWENRPVTDIPMLDVREFCRWFGRRLPTESEWEAAARHQEGPGRNQRWFPWGKKWEQGFANSLDQATVNPIRKTIPMGWPPIVPVGTYDRGASSLGIQDLSGNATEMTESPFTSYPGFAGKDIKGRRVTSGDFNADEFVVRGGDGNKRDGFVTTFVRLGIDQATSYNFVGFRTAKSVIRGQDHIQALVGGGDMKQFLANHEALPSEQLSGEPYATLAWKDPERYSAMMSGGWDLAANLPAKANFISIVNRGTSDIRDLATLRDLAREKPVMLGLLHLDIPVVEPALVPGDYFILWQNSFIPEIDPEAATTQKPPNKRDKKQKEPDPVPEAFLIVPLRGRDRTPIRIEKFLPPAVVSAQPTKIDVRTEAGADGLAVVEILFSFPIRYNDSKTFLLSLDLKLPKEQAEMLE